MSPIKSKPHVVRSTTVVATVTPDLKKRVQKVAKRAGRTVSTYIELLLHSAVRDVK